MTSSASNDLRLGIGAGWPFLDDRRPAHPMIPHTIVMRERWQARKRADFYPYGQPWREVFARMAGAVDRFDGGGGR